MKSFKEWLNEMDNMSDQDIAFEKWRSNFERVMEDPSKASLKDLWRAMNFANEQKMHHGHILQGRAAGDKNEAKIRFDQWEAIEKELKSFEFAVKQKTKMEMCGTGAIYDGTKSPDYNWWGCPEKYHQEKKKKKAKNNVPRN